MEQQSSERARRAAACRRLVIRACCVCGTLTRGTQKRQYCSGACRDRRYRQRQHARRTVAALAPNTGAVEALVGELLMAYPEIVRRECAGHVARQAPVVPGTCANCGADFTGPRGKKYCSRHCRNAAGTAWRRDYREWQRGLPPLRPGFNLGAMIAGVRAESAAKTAARRAQWPDRQRRYRASLPPEARARRRQEQRQARERDARLRAVEHAGGLVPWLRTRAEALPPSTGAMWPPPAPSPDEGTEHRRGRRGCS
jgi:predicted nucleic acid-binding Zn ribbon protein